MTERQDLELKRLCVLEVYIRSACAICEPMGIIMTKLPLSTRDGLENSARPDPVNPGWVSRLAVLFLQKLISEEMSTVRKTVHTAKGVQPIPGVYW